MNSNLLKKYAELSVKIKELQDEKDAINIEVMNEILATGGDKFENEYGKFSIRKLKKYTYPAYVTEAKDEYDALKAKAEELEEATYTESPSLTFSAIKI